MTDVGEIIKALNDFGRFQHWLVLMITIVSPFGGFHMFSQLFMVIPVPHHCNTNWLDAIHLNLTEEAKLNLTIPRNPDGTLEPCLMYTPMETNPETILQSGLNSTEKCQDGWVFSSKPKPSLITQFSLVCDREDLIDISQSIFMSGLLVGAVVLGPLSDWYGRRPIALLSLFLEGAAGVAVAFAPSFYLYCGLRFLLGAALSGINISSTALCTEWVGIAYRPHAIITTHVTFALGQMILAGLAYGLQDWRHLQIAGSAPIFVFFFYICTMIIKAILFSFSLLFFQFLIFLIKLTPKQKPNSSTVLDLIRNPQLAKMTLISSLIWFVNSLAYYGLSLNVGSFGLNIYLTQVIFGAVEIPARILSVFLMQRFGRKKCQSLCLLLGGTFSLLIIAVPKDLPVVTTLLAVLGKFTMAASFSTSYVYSAELFPTIIRQTGLGVCQMTARVAGIISPLVDLLEKYSTSLPVGVFGSAAVVGGVFTLLLPETLGKELPDCVDDLTRKSRKGKKTNDSVENGCAKPNKDSCLSERITTTHF
ncbi:PREDICTED: solute carrier family 22 member 13-like [Thamnophis sirtalis]|uniref:Solute carrier family 22 member 13-like n=1 Tax=Thamnophis sirtalis TaxID=35019 RepID=A0A6I9X4J8_9SAUR|nr:PREDICTED: solute carrier family 22 member 13-like [Thamnophis sirtalis]